MIQVTGTGPQASSVIWTSHLPAGFYLIGHTALTTGIPVAPAQLTLLPTLSAGAIDNASVLSQMNMTAAQPALAAASGAAYFYIEPGQTISLEVQKFNFGGNPDADWTFTLYVGAAGEVAEI